MPNVMMDIYGVKMEGQNNVMTTILMTTTNVSESA